MISRYLDHLPAAFAAGGETDPSADPAFTGRFLLAFERILTGFADTTRLTADAAKDATRLSVEDTSVLLDRGVIEIAGEQLGYTVTDATSLRLDAPLANQHAAGAVVRLLYPRAQSSADSLAPGTSGFEPLPVGIETLLDNIKVFFDPGPNEPGDPNEPPTRAPDDFLPWLAGWVATSLRDDWSTETQRAFIRRVASLYRKRGTKQSIETLLRIYLGNGDETTFDAVKVDDFPDDPARTPHYFLVSFRAPPGDSPEDLARRYNIARAILDQEKPAHTYYGLEISFPRLQIQNDAFTDHVNKRKGIWVGKSTVLGTQT